MRLAEDDPQRSSMGNYLGQSASDLAPKSGWRKGGYKSPRDARGRFVSSGGLKIVCRFCESPEVVKSGFNSTKDGPKQRYKCKNCGRTFTPTSKLVKGNKFHGGDNDIREAEITELRKFKRFVKEDIYPLLGLELYPQAKYTAENFLDLMTHMAITHDFAENGSKTFRLVTKGEIPSSDDLLWHLAKFNPAEIERRFTAVFDKIFHVANEMALLRGKRFDVAVDFYDWPYYGKRVPGVIDVPRKKGTSKGYRFMTICIVKPGFRLTLLALPICDYSEMIGAVEKLLKFAMRRIKINRIYCDRWFYKREVVRVFKRLKVKFLIRAPESTGIKKIGETGSLPVVMDYEMRGHCPPYGREKVKLFIVRSEDEESGMIYFITNSNVDEKNANRFAELYQKRWGIETSYRVKGDFKPKTASRKYVIRLFYFMFSVCLYNCWVLANLTIEMVLLKFVPGGPFITAKFFGIALYLQSAPFDPG